MNRLLGSVLFVFACAVGPSAHSALVFNYELNDGRVISAEFEGGFTDAINPSRFTLTSATSLSLDGTAHSTPEVLQNVVSATGLFGFPGASPNPFISIDGSEFDFIVCDLSGGISTCDGSGGLIGIGLNAFNFFSIDYSDVSGGINIGVGDSFDPTDGAFVADRVSVSLVPIPGTLLLMGLGCCGLVYRRITRLF